MSVTALRTLARRLLGGFWFVPGAVALGYALLAFAMVSLDRAVEQDPGGVGFGGDAGAAEGILSTIAGSLITVAGLAFSLTVVVLSLVSSQFTPRALPSLLADRTNQVVAGSFVGVFAYCLLVLRTVRSESGAQQEFVPGLSISVAIVLSLVSLALLLLFIHHMARSIQVSQIAARIAREMLATIDRLYPEVYERGVDASGDDLIRAWEEGDAPRIVSPERPGYVQAIELDELVAHVRRPEARVYIPVRPGDFVTPASTLAAVWPADALPEDEIESFRRVIPIENERNHHDDAAYGPRQLADIAIKALSPGINDPTTADTCIGYLRAALERLAERRIPSEVRSYSEQGIVGVARRRTFDEYVAVGYAEIGRFATDNASVVVSVLEALEAIARACRAAGALERTRIVFELACAVADPALVAARTERDRTLIRGARQRVEDACAGRLDDTLPP